MKNFSGSKIQERIVKSAEIASPDTWAFPNVEKPLDESDTTTNALGKKRQWRYEPPEEVEEEVVPLTAEDIEQIRQAAFEEGFNQGKEEGFATGFDEGKKAGHHQGLTEGHAEGVETGLEEGRATIEALTENWQQLIEQLHHPLAEVEKNVEQQLLQLVAQLTEAITLHEANTNPDILFSALEAGMKALPSQESQTQIMLNPQDITLIEQQYGAEVIADRGWRLLPMPQLARGSCQIENATSNIDLSVKSRIREVLESFLQEALHQ